ncbi:MAG TPA: HEAT repeat domain-containing protein, partial [Phycisphaerae bacterium]|nr:HEAT repeat domain-containing protein [Phycisphaerae bacterium]
MQRPARMTAAGWALLLLCVLVPAMGNSAMGQEAAPPAPATGPASAAGAQAESPAVTTPPPTSPDAASPAATAAKAVPMSQRPETIEKFMQYYLDMYSLHLKSPDWMARAMGVISLARLDDPRATQLLMQTMLGDKEELVRIYAWEAVHGRQDRLSPEQRYLWIRTGFDLHRQKALR